MEVRGGLEVLAAGLAAERASGEDLKKIERALAQMKEDLRTGAPGDVADLKFHYSIVEAAHNQLLLRMMNTIYDTMYQSLHITRKLWLSSTPGTPQRLYEEVHREVYMAVKSGNSNKASESMAEHLRKVITDLEGLYRLQTRN